MNKVGAAIISGVIFGGVGFASGYFFAKKRYLALADREIESMKSKQEAHDEWMRELYSKKDKDNKTSSVSKEKDKLAGVVPSTVGTKNDRLDYEKKYRGLKTVSEEIIDREGYAEKREKLEDDKVDYLSAPEDVRFMSVDEFDASSNSCSTIYYYKKDGRVTDASNNIINNYEGLIGPISFWEPKFGNKDVIYLTNSDKERDFEIIMLNEAWEDVATPSQKALVLNVGEKRHED